MDLRIDGKVALITAATDGIGLATAIQLAEQGASLRINGRSSQRLEVAKQKIHDAVPGTEVHTVVGDVSTAAGCRAIIDAVP
ncbi:MAG: SDR family NAD(P)-dependent oxidoreductase, partial [Beutenbergiaceae bacterium]